jgi:hypothetical protein
MTPFTNAGYEKGVAKRLHLHDGVSQIRLSPSQNRETFKNQIALCPLKDPVFSDDIVFGGVEINPVTPLLKNTQPVGPARVASTGCGEAGQGRACLMGSDGLIR